MIEIMQNAKCAFYHVHHKLLTQSLKIKFNLVDIEIIQKQQNREILKDKFVWIGKLNI